MYPYALPFPALMPDDAPQSDGRYEDGLADYEPQLREEDQRDSSMLIQDPILRPAANPDGILDGSRILIIDDNEDLCRSLALLLKSYGVQTDTVCQPSRAQQRLAQGGYDLVILDLVLEGVDGFTLFRFLRQQLGDKDTPVLFLSALVEPRHCPMQSGHDDINARFMSKSDLSRDLVAEVMRLLG